MIPLDRSTLSIRIATSIAVALILVGGASVALGQAVPPNAYYGAAQTESGTPAPDGTVLVAVADGEVQDEITVSTPGQYGGSDPTDEKLRVDSEIESEVTFHVGSRGGPVAAETDPNPESEVEELDLTFPNGAFGNPTSTPTPAPTETPTPVTETPTATETPMPVTATATATPAETGTVTETTPTAEPAATGTTVPTAQSGDDSGGTEAVTETSTTAGTARSGSRETATQDRQFVVRDLTVDPPQVSPGTTTVVNATVLNTGGNRETYVVGLAVDGRVVGTERVTVTAGGTRTVQFQFATDETGRYELAVNGTGSETLIVGQPSPTTTSQSGGFPLQGLLRPFATFVLLPIAIIYLVLKALAIYYGY